MAGFFPQAAIHQLRGTYFLISVLAPQRAHVLHNELVDTPATRMPEHHARGFFLQMKQAERLADLAVIALFRFFQTMQIGIE